MLSNLKSRSIIRLRQKSVFRLFHNIVKDFDYTFISFSRTRILDLYQNSIYNSHQENKNSNKLMFWDAVYISWRIVFEHVIVLIPYSIREIVKYKHANTSFSFWEITCHQEAQLNLIKGVKLRLLYLAGSDPSFVIRLH